MNWTTQSLAEALEKTGNYNAVVTDETALSVFSKEQEMPLVVVIKGDYMSVEAKMFDETEIVNSANINELLLKATDFLQLSAFTIREVEGIKTYFIVGQLSSSTIIENVKLEIETMFDNLMDAADLVLKQNEIDSKE
ncbi:DUF2170 family protein [Vibrio vulnificus]|nr:DUF2170 family protein [Vibrio vulnificus]